MAAEPLPEIQHLQQGLAGEEAPARDGQLNACENGRSMGSAEASTRQPGRSS